MNGLLQYYESRVAITVPIIINVTPKVDTRSIFFACNNVKNGTLKKTMTERVQELLCRICRLGCPMSVT